MVNMCIYIHMHYSIGPDGRYQYVGDLMKLQLGESCGMIDSRLTSVNTPLNYAAWKQQLQCHLDQDFVEYILNGIQIGFRIGVNPIASFKSAKQNMQSAMENKLVVDEYIQKEVECRSVLLQNL